MDYHRFFRLFSTWITTFGISIFLGLVTALPHPIGMSNIFLFLHCRILRGEMKSTSFLVSNFKCRRDGGTKVTSRFRVFGFLAHFKIAMVQSYSRTSHPSDRRKFNKCKWRRQPQRNVILLGEGDVSISSGRLMAVPDGNYINEGRENESRETERRQSREQRESTLQQSSPGRGRSRRSSLRTSSAKNKNVFFQTFPKSTFL